MYRSDNSANYSLIPSAEAVIALCFHKCSYQEVCVELMRNMVFPCQHNTQL